MKSIWHSDARNQLAEFPQHVRNAVGHAVDRLAAEGTGYEHVGLASGHGIAMWKIVVDPDDADEIDHRVIFDIRDDEFVIYGVWHRDNAYSPAMWDTVATRERTYANDKQD
jgi:mRNA-degrading endonuclease RelE of RelBE toxin-antitoxin system